MPNKSQPPPIRNQLLAALPRKVYKRLIPHLEHVSLRFMDVLYESGEAIEYVYFPNEGLISLLVVMGDKTPREVGLIIHESDEEYEAARAQFSAEELVKLTVVVIAINGWNCLAIAFRTEAGEYQPRGKAE